jgi:hypothetical protein
MNNNLARTLLLLGAAFIAAFAPVQAAAKSCSQAGAAGKWSYTYSGTILTAAGPVPAASVGSFSLDSSGSLAGSQTRSLGGNSGVETISGTLTVNRDCTNEVKVNVYQNGELVRSAVLAGAFDDKQKHDRFIFESSTLANGTSLPVIITGDGNKQFPDE